MWNIVVFQAVYYPIRTLYTYLKNRIQQDQQSDVANLSSPVKEVHSVQDKTSQGTMAAREVNPTGVRTTFGPYVLYNLLYNLGLFQRWIFERKIFKKFG